jgi:signal recognition particle receptor subunit beta
MVLINYAGREINAKIVYYGPGLSGKTTNLECIYASVPGDARGKMVSMKTRQDRTLFFDFLPLELGEVHGFRTRFLLYTVPGQVFYNATRKLVLKGADAVVFVADSERGKMDDNLESLRNLEENLAEGSLSLDTMPWVIQYNKRDLPNVYPVAELQQVLNTRKAPYFEAAAANGQGVYETLHAVSKLLFQRLVTELRTTVGGKPAGAVPGRVAPAAPARQPVPAPAMAPGGGSGLGRSAVEPSPRMLAPRGEPQFSRRGGNVPAEPTPDQIFDSVQATARGRAADQPFEDYGHTIDLEVTAVPDAAVETGFIKDPLRAPATTRQTDAGPDASPAMTYRVPVVVSQADFRPGTAIRIVLDLRVEA